MSILEALIFGAGEACVDIGVTSLLGGIVLFIGCVVLLRYLGAKMFRSIWPSRKRASEPVGADKSAPDATGLPDRTYEPPIRSLRAWGSKRQ